MEFDFSKYFNAENLERLMWALIILVVGIAVIYLVAFMVKRLLPKSLSQQRKMIIQRLVYYSGFLLLAFIVIAQLKINLAPFFGAAGVIGLVIGVASQTSIGNIVSGFFLVGEKSFEIGDVIKVGDKAGVVFSIDLLSIKIRTFDNQLLRIPNQTIISTELINVTRFPIRRLDIIVSVAYKEDLARVKTVLEEVVKANPLSLDEPEPLITFKAFGASGIDILVGIWFEKQNYLKVKNSVFQEIKARFDAEGIEIPFPHLTLYTGEATKPFPVINTTAGK
ncbi:Mechanosensitive ion channel [Draconibacterium orientale]|uniref:Mechanosensitive ion channel n=1 Tax=Draconibacterium orientale TaxID=1168034 RepID=X5DL24_9BACT|nr:mechanosensitive ion channel family protein [Draconibacterium orientale]AHW61252.1 mechanosensitive ion channel protein [Draconibacterium orientale]SET94518.1 Mechanosensitive ion channel [Draconibacterium orientale]